MDPRAAASIVALRPSLENLIVKVSENPESFFPLVDVDQKLVNIVVELCRMEPIEFAYHGGPRGEGGGNERGNTFQPNWQSDDMSAYEAEGEGGGDEGEGGDDEDGDDEVGGDYSSEARGVKRTMDRYEETDGPAKVARTSVEGGNGSNSGGRGYGGNSWGNRGGFQNRGGFRGGSGYGERGSRGGGYGGGRGGGYGGG